MRPDVAEAIAPDVAIAFGLPDSGDDELLADVVCAGLEATGSTGDFS